MKSLIARTFVLALVVTGASATAHSSSTSKTAVAGSAFPVPTCPWNDPHGCGLDGSVEAN